MQTIARPKSAKIRQNVSSDEKTEEHPVEGPQLTFDDLGLSRKVVAAVADAGYTIRPRFRRDAIPHAVAGKDVLGIAQTGTGKTAAFSCCDDHPAGKGPRAGTHAAHAHS